MLVEEIYKHWVLQHNQYHSDLKGVKPADIEKVTFHSFQNAPATTEFDTFAGCEMWHAEVYLKNRQDEFDSIWINLWDSNPVSSIVGFAKDKGWDLEFPKEEPSIESQLEGYIRHG